jgi:hypothetical protein
MHEQVLSVIIQQINTRVKAVFEDCLLHGSGEVTDNACPIGKTTCRDVEDNVVSSLGRMSRACSF